MSDNDARSPFRIRRAEKMQETEVISSYCPPAVTTHLMDSRTIILQGARGSGKSTILRFLASSPTPGNNLRNDKRLITGSYVSLAKAWVAGFQRRAWIASAHTQLLFAQSLNLYIAENFVPALQRLIEHSYPDEETAARNDALVARLLLEQFLQGDLLPRYLGLRDLRKKLESMQRDLRDSAFRSLLRNELILPEELVLGEIFEPITRAVHNIQDALGLAGGILWLFAFDELDNLGIDEQVLFNTIIRNISDPIVIKAACLPHGHRTRDTLASGNPVIVGEDFDYVALTNDPKSEDGRRFCLQLYQKRVTLADSRGLSQEPHRWVGDANLRERSDQALKKRYPSDTWESVLRRNFRTELPGSMKELNDDSIRQYVATLAIRLLRLESRGNADQAAYAGWSDIVAASDGNPRRLLRLLDRLYDSTSSGTKLSNQVQSRIIQEVADSAFDKLVGLPNQGRRIQELVGQIGSFLEDRLHRPRYIAKDSCSFEVSLDTLDEETRDVVTTAIDYGVIFPWKFDERNGYPTGLHRYWLSFGIAPRFWLVLRRGKPVLWRQWEKAPTDAQLALPFELPMTKEGREYDDGN